MNKHTSDSSHKLETVVASELSAGTGLHGIAASLLNQKSSDVIDRMLAHAAQELEKRKLIEKDDALIKIIELVKTHSIPFDDITHLLNESGAIFANHSGNGRTRRIFVDPNDPKTVWSGVGRRPHWLLALVGKKGDVSPFGVDVVTDETQLKAYYYNPDKPAQRWNGLGRKPFWFTALEASGVDVEQFKTYF